MAALGVGEQQAEGAVVDLAGAGRAGVLAVEPAQVGAQLAGADLPDPDAVFIEGSGREIARLAELAFERLKPAGRLVASVASIEGLYEVKAILTAATSDVNVWMLNVSRGTDQLQRLRLNALNPAFLVAATKS